MIAHPSLTHTRRMDYLKLRNSEFRFFDFNKNEIVLSLQGTQLLPDLCVCLNCVKSILEASEVERQIFRLRGGATSSPKLQHLNPKSNAKQI